VDTLNVYQNLKDCKNILRFRISYTCPVQSLYTSTAREPHHNSTIIVPVTAKLKAVTIDILLIDLLMGFILLLNLDKLNIHLVHLNL